MGSRKVTPDTFVNPSANAHVTAPGSFQQFYDKMPAQFFGNSQIHDPTAILNAYMQNMPKMSLVNRSITDPNAEPAPAAPAPAAPKSQSTLKKLGKLSLGKFW